MAIAEFSWDVSKKRFAFPGIGVTGSKLSDEVLIGNARWFIIFRWAVVVVLLLFQIFALIASDTLTKIGITHQQGWPIAVTAVLCVANIIYIYALDFRRQTKYNSPSINIWVQIIIDLLCLSVVVHYVGSTATPVPFFYVLHIALSCIFFSTVESLIVTALVCAMYAIVLIIENPLLFLAPQSVLVDSGTSVVTPLKINILLWMFTLNVLFVIVWYVVSRLSIVVRTHERHLMDAYEQISRAQVEKDRYAVLMTHQLKAPLDAIRSKINLIKGNYCGETSPEIKDVLVKIDNRASGMAGLILDVLKLERLKAAARDTDNLECVNIEMVIRKCIDKLNPIANSRHINIQASTVDFAVECIPNQLEILFENIISNAVAYSYDGASVEIVSSVNKQSLSAVVTVIDHGIGIGDKDLPHIFDEYFYTPRAALHNRTSSGIGLSIVKTVAENNKLHIKVSSEQNVGTAFSVIFQRVKNESVPEKDTQQPSSQIARPVNSQVESLESGKSGGQLASTH
ncbi:HAMP domain-containing sensor histidine kinase [Nitrosovibrio sp. Nv6]|uniref:sensor histidine kinase n=1 Tax=Nitrosovibrio sp. Nv6 TaxID=1855340 RepID=UPI0008BBD363|nr:HAMP domain-containing sensor histidine kinase [Nitrosovibrio sp. Nv6]SEP24162.1 Signal transduction histidine kinase [Nitrosovibrio sp. Nv6]